MNKKLVSEVSKEGIIDVDLNNYVPLFAQFATQNERVKRL